jgi:hypothetical protein
VQKEKLHIAFLMDRRQEACKSVAKDSIRVQLDGVVPQLRWGGAMFGDGFHVGLPICLEDGFLKRISINGEQGHIFSSDDQLFGRVMLKT